MREELVEFIDKQTEILHKSEDEKQVKYNIRSFVFKYGIMYNKSIDEMIDECMDLFAIIRVKAYQIESL